MSKIKIIITCLFSIISFHLFAQIAQVNHWETVFNADAVFKYQTNNNPVTDNNWRNNNFNDSGWTQGNGGIGYGDNDDNTVINNITSVFFRKQFNVVNKDEIAAAILNIDYDDAFVAYLNGVEIARSVGLTDPFPAYDALSSIEHEAVFPQGGTPPNIVIDNEILQANLVNGTNTIAVQVHNLFAGSSDLSSNTWFTVGLNVATQRYSSTPSWFNFDSSNVFSSNLPILIIDTENGATIQDEPKTNAHLGIIYNGEGERNYTDDPFTEYDGNIGIEIRGNSTADWPKKPWNFETRDNAGENLNVPLLGMPEENDWVLLASYLDHTFARNSLAGHMSRLTDRWASNTRHVEVILNGEYQGIYILMERNKRDKNRIDIASLDPTETTGEDLTGGYIWEVTGFGNDFGENRKLIYPKIEDVQPEQLQYIKNFDDAFRNKMRQPSSFYSNPNTGYVQYIWTESFIYELIVQEAIRNSDAYGFSSYFHKDKNELINAGPVWDFDQSAGNSSYPDDGVITGWMAENNNTYNTPFFWRLLLNDPYFKYSLSLRWKELRADKFKTENLLAYIDSIADTLSEAQAREFEKWPVLGVYFWRETTGYDQRTTFQAEIDYLKDYLTQRWAWMDSELANVPKPSGYPDISITENITDMVKLLEDKNVKIANLNDYFSFPYSPELKFKVSSSNPDVISVDLKKSDALDLDFTAIGNSDITITAIDTYGNKKNISFNLQVDPNPDVVASGPFVIYPNPASTDVNFQLNDKDVASVEIDLYSINGQLIERIYKGEYTQPINYLCNRLENRDLSGAIKNR